MLTYFRCVGGRIEAQPELRAEDLAQRDAQHWIDLEDPTVNEAALLEEPFHFHPLAIEDCLSDVHLPKLDDYENYLFAILHGVWFEAESDQFVTRELDLFLGPNFLVTHHRGNLRVITAAREQCGKNLMNAFPRGVDFLMHQILDGLFDDYLPSLDAIEDKIQMLQVEVFEAPSQDTLDRIFGLKRDVMRLKRICMPQREIVHRLSRGEFPVIGPKAAVYFRDIYDSLYRIVEASFSYHDMIQGTLDAYLSSVNNRLNETMKRLTVISALLAPLTVITGIYGMNFEYLPETQWRYGYPGVLFGMLAVSGGLLYWFRKKRWV